MHPHLQQHLADNIQSETSENLQLIITSHSTHITSKLDLENTAVLFFDKDVNSHKSHYILSGFADENEKGKVNTTGKKTQRYLRRYLDATKSTMFFARRIILVEDISEQILIPKLFKLHKKKSLEEVHTTRATENIKTINSSKATTDFYSTIHTAKGLEATSVLVCAKIKNQLLKWLAADKIITDDDDFRLGYVAFSRARKFLAIACLQSVDISSLNIVKSFGIKLSNEVNNNLSSR